MELAILDGRKMRFCTACLFSPYLYDICLSCIWLACVSVCMCPDEEISNMRRELDKYGIQMPAFSKIGGMLASEVRHRHTYTDRQRDRHTCTHRQTQTAFSKIGGMLASEVRHRHRHWSSFGHISYHGCSQ